MDDLFDEKPKQNATEQDKKGPDDFKLDKIEPEKSSIITDDLDEKTEDEYDLQKELEAKFDELFGPIDEDN